LPLRRRKIDSRHMIALVTSRLLLVLCLLGGSLAAQSIIVVDTFNKKIHVGGNISQKRAVGGIAKIATALVAIDWVQGLPQCPRHRAAVCATDRR